jgi:predicted ATPase
MDIEFKDIDNTEYKLNGLSRINILFGRNGSGKSSFLRELYKQRGNYPLNQSFKHIGFIGPERGGSIQIEHNTEINLRQPRGQYIQGSRANTNRSNDFRQQATSRLRMLKEHMFEKTLETDNKDEQTDLITDVKKVISQINSLLSNIKIDMKSGVFAIVSRKDSAPINHEFISSGESEIITLLSDIMYEVHVECTSHDGNKLLIIDEPDVHLHPDLQARFMYLLENLCENHSNIYFLISTHSINIPAAMSHYPDSKICYMNFNQKILNFDSPSDKQSRIMPLLGSNLLSRVFNNNRLLVVEGIDEVHVWEQAIQTSQGKINVSPCACGGNGEMDKYEKDAAAIASVMYENPIVFSMHDGDNLGNGEAPEERCHGIVKRFYLQCHSLENLSLTNEVFAKRPGGITWENFKEKATAWVNDKDNNLKHGYTAFSEFKNGGYNRQSFPLKKNGSSGYDLMPIICHICGIGNTEPFRWTDLVGKVVGDIAIHNPTYNPDAEGSIMNYLGKEFLETVILQKVFIRESIEG